MITNSPNTLSDLNTPQWFRVTATNSGETNYNYTFDVQTISYTGSIIETVGRYKLPNRPDSSCLFTPHKILKPEITYGLNINSNILFEQNQDMMVYYRLRVGEEYNTNVTFDSTQGSVGFLELILTTASEVNDFKIGDVIYINKDNKVYNSEYDGTCSVTATSSTYIRTDKAYSATILANESGTIESISRYTENSSTYSAIPRTREYYERTTDFGSTYLMASASNGYFLTTNNYTSFTNAKEIYENEYESVSLVVNNTDQAYNAEIVFYNSSQVAIGTYSGVTTSNVDAGFYRLELSTGTQQLENVLGSIPTGSEYYKIRVKNLNAYISHPIYYRIMDCKPSFYIRLVYLNAKGGYEFITFDKRQDTSESFNRKQYTKTLDYDYSMGDRGDTVYNIDSEYTVKINTDWLGDRDNANMAELLKSSDVYFTSNTVLYPIVMQDQNIEYKYVRNIEMAQYTLTFKYAYKNNTNSL